MVLLLAMLGAVGGIFYAQMATPIYRVTAELEMNVRRPKVINSDVVFEDPTAVRDTDVIFNTRFKKFTSPAMESLAADEYMKRYPDEKTTSNGLPIGGYTLALWVQDVIWHKDPNANIVYVTYEASDPDFAAQLVNVLAKCAGMLMMRENQEQSEEAVKWLVSQAEEQRDDLETVEQRLADLREEVGHDSLQQRKSELAQALVTVSDEREGLVSQRASRDTVFEFVSDLRDSDPNLEMLPPCNESAAASRSRSTRCNLRSPAAIFFSRSTASTFILSTRSSICLICVRNSSISFCTAFADISMN